MTENLSAARTAFADQYAAATATVNSSMDELVMDQGYHPGIAQADPWLRALLVDAASAECQHLTLMSAPEPVFVSAHLRRLECAPCRRAEVEATIDTLEDVTCDRCRTIPTDGHLRTAVASTGPISIPLGLCGDCLTAIRGSGWATS